MVSARLSLITASALILLLSGPTAVADEEYGPDFIGPRQLDCSNFQSMLTLRAGMLTPEGCCAIAPSALGCPGQSTGVSMYTQSPLLTSSPHEPDVLELTGCVGSPAWHRREATRLGTQFENSCTRGSAESADRSELYFEALTDNAPQMELKRKLFRAYAGEATPREIEENASEFEQARRENAVELRLAEFEQALAEFRNRSVRQGGTRNMPGLNSRLVDSQVRAFANRIGYFRAQMRALSPARSPERQWTFDRRKALMQQVGWLTTGYVECEVVSGDSVCRRRQNGNLEQLLEGLGEPTAGERADELEQNAFEAARQLKAKAEALLASLTSRENSEFAATLIELNAVNRCRRMGNHADSHSRRGRMRSCASLCAERGGQISTRPNGTPECRRGAGIADADRRMLEQPNAPERRGRSPGRGSASAE